VKIRAVTPEVAGSSPVAPAKIKRGQPMGLTPLLFIVSSPSL